MIVLKIIDAIRETGAFVKREQKTGRYWDVGDHIAREKVSREFRLALASRKKQKDRVGITATARKMKSDKCSEHLDRAHSEGSVGNLPVSLSTYPSSARNPFHREVVM